MLYKHALRNALIPVVTVIGVGLPNIIAGTVIFEQIFIIPGMGRYLVDAVNNLDYPVIQGLNLVFALLLMVVGAAGRHQLRVPRSPDQVQLRSGGGGRDGCIRTWRHRGDRGLGSTSP